MAFIAVFVGLAGIPSAFVGIHFVGAAVHAGTDGDVVLLAYCVGKAEISEFRFFFFDQFQNIGGSHVRPRGGLAIWPGLEPGALSTLQLMCHCDAYTDQALAARAARNCIVVDRIAKISAPFWCTSWYTPSIGCA